MEGKGRVVRAERQEGQPDQAMEGQLLFRGKVWPNFGFNSVPEATELSTGSLGRGRETTGRLLQ